MTKLYPLIFELCYLSIHLILASFWFGISALNTITGSHVLILIALFFFHSMRLTHAQYEPTDSYWLPTFLLGTLYLYPWQNMYITVTALVLVFTLYVFLIVRSLQGKRLPHTWIKRAYVIWYQPKWLGTIVKPVHILGYLSTFLALFTLLFAGIGLCKGFTQVHVLIAFMSMYALSNWFLAGFYKPEPKKQISWLGWLVYVVLLYAGLALHEVHIFTMSSV